MQSEMPEFVTESVQVYSVESDLQFARKVKDALAKRGVAVAIVVVPDKSDDGFPIALPSPIIVVLLSPKYLATGSMPQRKAAPGDEEVIVRGLVARRYESESLPDHWRLPLLGTVTPLDELSDTDVHFVIERAVDAIFELTSADAAKTPEQNFGASPLFSASALRVLEKSREISSRKHLRAITTRCLLFGFSESQKVTRTAAFFNDLLSRNGKYPQFFNSYLEDRNEVIDGKSFEYRPFTGFFAQPLGPIMRVADLIARKTTGDGSIHARHLLAAMITEKSSDYPGSIANTVQALGMEIESVKREFRKFVAAVVPTDDQEAWDGFLGSITDSSPSEPLTGISLEEAMSALDEPGRQFVREVASVAVRLERPADTFSALALLIGWASDEPQWAAQGILDELRRQRGANAVEHLFFAPARYWKFGPDSPTVNEITNEFWSALKLTKELVARFELEGDLRFRILIAVIVGYDSAEPPNAAKIRLAELGFDLDAIRTAYRKYIAENRSDDPQELYDEILGPVTVSPESAEPQIKVDTAADSYRKGYSPFASDHVSYERRDLSRPLDDALGVGQYADNIAQLIAAQKTKMPLSIGLFGDWGSGKSYFMALLQERLSGIAESKTAAFHKKIVQIRFNAWHYLDTNLWASLVCEIFDQLFGALEENRDTTDAQIRYLKEELARESALAAEAKEALRIAENARLNAENELRAAMKEREKAETKVATLLDDLTVLIGGDADVQKELDAAAEGLGLPSLKNSYDELNDRVKEVRTLGGRARALALAVFTGRGWWTRSILLVVALSLPLVIGWIATLEIQWIQDLFSGAGKVIAQIATAILAVSGWIAQQARRGTSLLNKLEDAHKKVSDIRERRQAGDAASDAEKELAKKRQEEEQARHTLNEAEERMKKLRSELSELAPGRQLIRFLKDRVSADDYRRHLGLVSLVRRDFEKLSELLLATDVDRATNLPKIDRIVLYIDDLDRCRADRVVEVLEAVHLLLAFPLFAVVVAVDPRWLRQSLLDHYPSLLGGREEKSANRKPSRPPASPQDYLEKIFQVPFNLKDLDKDGYGALVKGLFEAEETSPNAIAAKSADQVGPDGTAEQSRQNIVDAAGEKEGNRQDKTIADEPIVKTEDQPAPPEMTKDAESKVVKVDPPSPPDPARLMLSGNEIADANLFQPLFRTPRAVKRFANTYCLIRVGVSETEWPAFAGFAKSYRIPMFMLAVTSAYPSLSRPWLTWLRRTAISDWTKISSSQVEELSQHYADSTEKADWESLAAGLDSLKLAEWNTGDVEDLHHWIARVSRFTF